MHPPTDDPAFNTEVIKLLLQVAWADDVLEPSERAFIAHVGRSWYVPDEVMAGLLSQLDQGRPLPQPNLFLLRQRAEAVVDAAEALIRADGIVDAQERDFVEMVEQLLGRG